jgi:hypothetical protein
LALLRVAGKPIRFSQEIMPICLPKGKKFPDSTGWVYVAGWGSHHEARTESGCTTNKHGPDPFSKCKFPFKYHNIVIGNCLRTFSPTKDNKKCMELYKLVNQTKFLDDGYGRVSRKYLCVSKVEFNG